MNVDVHGPTSVPERILSRAAANPRRILFLEARERPALEALSRLVSEGIVRPLLLGGAQGFDGGTPPDGVEILDPGRAAEGRADGTVLFEPAPDGTPTEGGLVSSFSLLVPARPTEAGEEVLAIADCAWVPDPDAAQLAEIARRTAEQFRLLLDDEPRVALLSFSTRQSARHPSVDRVRQAFEILRAAEPGLVVDGELQADAALVAAVGAAKAPGSPVAGRANVLIFPDRTAGRIASDLVAGLGGVQILGPFLCGLAHPVNRLSRGCRTEDIVLAAAVTALQAS